MPENATPKQQGGFKPGQSRNPAESGKEDPDACERRKPGRPPHRPTAYWRGQVNAYASCGTPHADIAAVIGTDAKTLRKHYAGELDYAAIKANAAVGRTAFLMAVGGPRRVWQKAVPSMTIFWLKTRMGWKDAMQVQHTGAVSLYDYSKLSDEELARLIALLELAAVAPEDR
jgi:hypothetical protein